MGSGGGLKKRADWNSGVLGKKSYHASGGVLTGGGYCQGPASLHISRPEKPTR